MSFFGHVYFFRKLAWLSIALVIISALAWPSSDFWGLGAKWEEGASGHVTVPQASEEGHRAGAGEAGDAGWAGPQGGAGATQQSQGERSPTPRPPADSALGVAFPAAQPLSTQHLIRIARAKFSSLFSAEQRNILSENVTVRGAWVAQ